MDTRDFCYWMAGFMELVQHGEGMSTTQVSTIKDHLKLVFDKITPDRFISALGDLDDELNVAKTRTVGFKDRTAEKIETTITCSAGDELPKSVDDSQYKCHRWTLDKTKAVLGATSADPLDSLKGDELKKASHDRAVRHFAEQLRDQYAPHLNPTFGVIKLC